MILVFTIGTCSLSPAVQASGLGGLSIGFCVTVLVFFGGHISGGHYNPAITIGVLATMRSKISLPKACGYVVVQIIGSVFGSLLAYAVEDGRTFGPTMERVGEGFLAELIGTFLLVTVVLNVATTEAQENNSFFGLAIGLTVSSMAIAVGDVSGGAFNPAVGTGPHLVSWFVGQGLYSNTWVYWIGPILGAVLAALFFRITNLQEYKLTHPNDPKIVGNSLMTVVEEGESSRQYYKSVQ